MFHLKSSRILTNAQILIRVILNVRVPRLVAKKTFFCTVIPTPNHIIQQIAFGGGCHWCTEAYFQSVRGVIKTEQGWVSSDAPHESFSEAVIVHYDPLIIPLPVLLSVHLHTHACTKNHSMREKYRSAVYVFGDDPAGVEQMIMDNQPDFEERIITQVLPFKAFRLNKAEQLNYYQKNKDNVFCARYIHPKLKMLEERYAEYKKG